MKRAIVAKAFVLFFSLCAFNCGRASAQRLGVSTNALGWCTLSPNAKLELNLSMRSSVAFEAAFNPFERGGGKSFNFVSVAPEYRYWFNQVMYSHYIGLIGRYAAYSIDGDRSAKRGDVLGLGVTYGYSFAICNRFNIVPNIGVGYGVRTNYNEAKPTGVPLLTNLGVDIQYIFRAKRR